MNASQNAEFQEALLLADYAIKTALVQIGVLDQPSIKVLQAIPGYESDIIQMLQSIEAATESLGQARLTAKRLINTAMEGDTVSYPEHNHNSSVDIEGLAEEEPEELINFSPCISDNERKELEVVAGSQNIGQQRRLVLLACARSANDLSELSTENCEAFSEMLGSIEAFKEHTQGLVEFAEAAVFRMKIADRREHELNSKHLINTSMEGMQ